MVSPLTTFNINECDKIDASLVNAYVTVEYDESNPAGIVIDSSWGTTAIDLTPIVKAAETVTSLTLDPLENPEYLVFYREDGCKDCIHGDDLSRIISLKYLKDVDQSVEVTGGDVYMYDSEQSLFVTYNLQKYIDDNDAMIAKINSTLVNLQEQITVLEGRVATLEETVANHETRLQTIEEVIAKPDGTPDDAKLVWGNINLYSDSTNAEIRTSGLYTHSTETNVVNDETFS